MTVRYVKAIPGAGPRITDRGTFEAPKAESKKKSKKKKTSKMQRRGAFSAEGAVVLLFDDGIERNQAIAALELLVLDIRGSNVLE